MPHKADVVVPVFSDPAATKACLESVLKHTRDELDQLIVVNDCSPDAQMEPMLRSLYLEHPEMVLIRNETNLGFVASANRGIALRNRDVVLLNSDTLVTPGWLLQMIEVAYSNDRIACVVPLSNNGAFCSVPTYCKPATMRELINHDLQLEQLPPSTILPTAVGFCVLLKDSVLNMIGGFDPAFGRGYNEENDWSMRAQTMGFVAARANRAVVYHLGSVSFGDEKLDLNRRNSELLLSRYPYFISQVRKFSESPEARIAAHHVRARLGQLSACLNLRQPNRGDSPEIPSDSLRLVEHLKRHTSIEVSVCNVEPVHTEILSRLGIETVQPDQMDEQLIYHQPAAITDPSDLSRFLEAKGHAVISIPDLIAWRTPSMHSSLEAFEHYRARCFAAAQSAQAILTGSEYNRQEIVAELRVPEDRTWTVFPGVDTAPFERRDQVANRERLAKFGIAAPYFIYAGTDEAHKNLKLLLAGYVLFRHGFRPREQAPSLVLALRASQTLGSFFTRGSEPLADGVHNLCEPEEQDLVALLQEALAFVYPVSYDGFPRRLVEAMAAGTPVVCSWLASLPEIAKGAALYIKNCSPDEIAARLSEIAGSEALRKQLIATGHRQAKEFTWKRAALKTAEIYQGVVDTPCAASLFRRHMLSTLLRVPKYAQMIRLQRFRSLSDQVRADE